MLEKIDELKVALQTIWEGLPQNHMQQGGGKLYQALDSLRSCQLWPLRESAVRVCPSPSLHPLLNTKIRLF